MKDQISKMAAELRDAEHALVFTGAGISTLSGIPDFRGAHGVYRRKWHDLEVEEILSLDCFRVHPEYFYEWAQTFVYGLENYQPNIVHTTVAKLDIFKELLQHECNPEMISDEVKRLLNDAPYREKMLKEYAEVRSLLGGGGASEAVAQAMIDELSK